MVKKTLIIFLTFFYLKAITSQTPYYKKYIEILNKENIDLKVQMIRKQKSDLNIEQKKKMISPFQLELQYETGTKNYPTNLLQLEEASSQKIKHYIIGLSKAIDVLSKQKTKYEIAQWEKELEDNYSYLMKKQILSEFRLSYFRLIYLQRIKEHLSKHINQFERLSSKYHKNYFDKKLGNYTRMALQIGISKLKSEYTEAESEIQKELSYIRQLLNFDNYLIYVDKIEDISQLFPTELNEKELQKDYEESPIYKAELIKLKIKQKEKELAKKEEFHSFEVFFQYGERETGNYKNLTFDPINPEKETTYTLGLRIPIPYGTESSMNKFLIQKEEEIQVLQIEKTKVFLKNQIQYLTQIYKNNYQLFQQNIQTLYQSEPYLEMLDDSLLNRRISFFEYWGEHEKFHDLLQLTLKTFEVIVESLNLLELYTGKNLFQDI
ncbi:MAG: TolC family protein [Leptospiraceae bacterium]|nr:TolC family protein [Leptospiraceae bacterium]